MSTPKTTEKSDVCIMNENEKEGMANAATRAVVPPPVQKGDKVGIVAPASPVDRPTIDAAVALLRSWDLEAIVHPSVFAKQEYLAGSDEERANALIEAFDDSGTTAVLCAAGGYGCVRLLQRLPLEKLGPHNLMKKRFFGFSDITALHCLMRLAIPGYVSFHAPTLASIALIEGTGDSKQALHDAMFSSSLQDACPPLKGRCLQMGRAIESEGRVKGKLVGGNLSGIAGLIGTPWQEGLSGCILLLEDVKEPVYRLDRMITQLSFANNKMKYLAALVIGDCDQLHRFDPEKQSHGWDVDSWFWLEQMKLPKDLPILSGIQIGHIKDNRVAALGSIVEVDLHNCFLQIAA